MGGQLQVGAEAVGEDEGGGAEGAVAVAALLIVGADFGEVGAVVKVTLEAVQVQLGGAGSLEEGGAFAVVLAVLVLGVEESMVVAEEGVLTLLARGDRGLEGGATAAAVSFGLLPKFPLGTFDGVDLFEREVPPGGLEAVADLVLNLAQPDRRAVDVGSTVVEVNVEHEQVVHRERGPW